MKHWTVDPKSVGSSPIIRPYIHTMQLSFWYSFLNVVVSFILTYFLLYKYSSTIFLLLVYGLRFDLGSTTITIANPELFLNTILHFTFMWSCFFMIPYVFLQYILNFLSSWTKNQQNKFMLYFLLFLYFYILAIIITCVDLYNSSWHIILDVSKTYTNVLTLNMELDLTTMVKLFCTEYIRFSVFLLLLFFCIVFWLENFKKHYFKKIHTLILSLLLVSYVYFFGLSLSIIDIALLMSVVCVYELFILCMYILYKLLFFKNE